MHICIRHLKVMLRLTPSWDGKDVQPDPRRTSVKFAPAEHDEYDRLLITTVFFPFMGSSFLISIFGRALVCDVEAVCLAHVF